MEHGTQGAALLAVLLASMSAQAQVAWVGPDCRIAWDANPAAELVEGYRVYLEADNPVSITQQSVVGATEITCSALGLTQGIYEAYVTAYNPAGESAPSARYPFVLATSAPGGPGGVSAPQGLRIESAGVAP